MERRFLIEVTVKEISENSHGVGVECNRYAFHHVVPRKEDLVESLLNVVDGIEDIWLK